MGYVDTGDCDKHVHLLFHVKYIKIFTDYTFSLNENVFQLDTYISLDYLFDIFYIKWVWNTAINSIL